MYMYLYFYHATGVHSVHVLVFVLKWWVSLLMSYERSLYFLFQIVEKF